PPQPAFRASTIARMPASGVRRSCDTQATRSRRLASAARSFSRASAAHIAAAARRRPSSQPAARLTVPDSPTTRNSTRRSCSSMNIAWATATMPARTVSTQTATSRQTCHTIEAPRMNRYATAPSAGTASTARTTSASVIDQLVPVPDAPHGADPPRLGRVVLHLLAQPPHMHGYRGLVAECPAPHGFQQPGPLERPARLAHEAHHQDQLPYP